VSTLYSGGQDPEYETGPQSKLHDPVSSSPTRKAERLGAHGTANRSLAPELSHLLNDQVARFVTLGPTTTSWLVARPLINHLDSVISNGCVKVSVG